MLPCVSGAQQAFGSCMQRWGQNLYLTFFEVKHRGQKFLPGQGEALAAVERISAAGMAPALEWLQEPHHVLMCSSVPVISPLSDISSCLAVTVWFAITWHRDKDGAVGSVIMSCLQGREAAHAAESDELLHCNDLRCI